MNQSNQPNKLQNYVSCTNLKECQQQEQRVLFCLNVPWTWDQ